MRVVFPLLHPPATVMLTRMRRFLHALVFALLWTLPRPAAAWDPDTLLIWINGDKGYEGITEIGQKFTENTGIPVKVEHPEGATRGRTS